MASNAEVEFHSASIDFSPDAQDMLRAWLRRAFEGEGQNLVSLNFVFCSDAYLLNINQQFLNHDDFTDVITFDYGGEDGLIIFAYAKPGLVAHLGDDQMHLRSCPFCHGHGQ